MALSNPIRRHMLSRLKITKELTVSELGKAYRISLPAITRHVKTLEKASLITRRIEGSTHFIRINHYQLKKLVQLHHSFLTPPIKKNTATLLKITKSE